MSGNVFALNNKRIIRSEPNEFDKATIVSIFPQEIVEIKHTVFPGKFVIPAGTVAKPSITTVGPSAWYRDMGDEMPAIEIPNNAVQIANSIVTDYCNGLLMSDKDCRPGVFFIAGEWTLKEVLDKYRAAFDKAVNQQNAWWRKLLELADTGWAVTNGNPKAISSVMRLAALELGVPNRDWMSTTILQELIKCVACGNLRNPKFPVCGSCNRIIDTDLAKKLGLEIPK